MNFIARNRRAIMTFGCALLMLSVFTVITGCGGITILTDLEAVIPTAGAAIAGLAAIIASFVGGGGNIAQEITAAVTVIDTELKNAETLVAEYKANPSDTALENIEAAINLVTSNLQTLLTAADVPAALATKIQTIAQAVLGQLEALLSVIPVLKNSTAGQTIANVSKPINKAAFKTQVETMLKS